MASGTFAARPHVSYPCTCYRSYMAQDVVFRPAEYVERALFTMITAPRPLLEETVEALLLRVRGEAVVVAGSGRPRDQVFAEIARRHPGVQVLRATSPSQIISLAAGFTPPLIIVIHDPDIYDGDDDAARRVAVMLREHAWTAANRIVLMGRPGEAFLDEMWPAAGKYLYIEQDSEWKNGRMTCDRQMTLDAICSGSLS
ncbi:hypothetical protein AZH53_01230 [Methanomicrobiaceae archaeon CYW5]|nr:hypothetical protein [Methanovulcanius yangii]